MHSTQILAALAALSVSAVHGATTCTKDIKVTETAQVIPCDVVDADITVDSKVTGELFLNGPKQVKGDITIKGASGIYSITSTSINSIGGKFTVNNLEQLTAIDMSALRNVNAIELTKLNRLDTLNFGTEGLKVKTISITDTSISDLSGLSVETVESLTLSSNKRMSTFNSDLVNVTGLFSINNFNVDMDVTLEKLESVGGLDIRNAKSFEVPNLSTIDEDIRFDGNSGLKEFNAPNVTKIGGELAFQNNKNLANVSFPLLESLKGGLTIINNTKLATIDGFPKLKSAGAINFFGDFKKVKLPSLKTVSGTVNVQSTTDISNFCDPFNKLKDDGGIEGENNCKSNNKEANEGKDGGESKSGNSSGDDSKSDDDEDAAGIVSVNMAVLGLTLVVGLAQLF